MTVGEMLERMDSRELTEWWAFNSLEPIGDERADFRAGVIAATVAAMLQPGKQRRKFRPEDFMFFRNDKAREKADTWEKQLAVVEQLNAAFGGIDRRPKGQT